MIADMVELSAISVALSLLRMANDVAETMDALPNITDLQSKLVEIKSKLVNARAAVFAAQDERLELLERVHRLEHEIAELKARESKWLRRESERVIERAHDRNGTATTPLRLEFEKSIALNQNVLRGAKS